MQTHEFLGDSLKQISFTNLLKALYRNLSKVKRLKENLKKCTFYGPESKTVSFKSLYFAPPAKFKRKTLPAKTKPINHKCISLTAIPPTHLAHSQSQQQFPIRFTD